MAKASLTYSSALVLEAIATGRRYGFDVMEVTGLASGTVYPALRRLERLGLVSGSWEAAALARREGRPSRRYYVLTGAGGQLVETARARYPGLLRAVGAGSPSPATEGS